MAKILIVDDHPATREGLAMRVARQPDLAICGEATDVDDALQLVEATRPDLVVVDICLKNGNGIDLIKRLKAQDSSLPMLAWSMHDEAHYAERALHAGALGYVDKTQATDTVVDAIRCVLKGKVYLSAGLADQLLRQSIGGIPRLAQSSVSSLSDRELEVLQFIGQGVNTQEVAQRMHITSKTVDTYRGRIKDKLHLRSGIELMRFAVQWVLERG